MTLAIGDVLTWNGRAMEVTSEPRAGEYWLQEQGTHNYFFAHYLVAKDLASGLADGSIKIGKPEKILKEGQVHAHFWRPYEGATTVDEYCYCGARRAVDWREIGLKINKDSGQGSSGR